MSTMQLTGVDTVPRQFGDAASCCQSLEVEILGRGYSQPVALRGPVAE